jgi:ATP:cob(I)alamin adenosyltransferase
MRAITIIIGITAIAEHAAIKSPCVAVSYPRLAARPPGLDGNYFVFYANMASRPMTAGPERGTEETVMHKHLAYSFLYEDASDLKCDFEILSDEIASMIGLLRSLAGDQDTRDDLTRLNEIMYHLNPSLRTRVTVTEAELRWLEERMEKLRQETRDSLSGFPRERNKPVFVIPQGCEAAAHSHVIRNKCKALVRLLSRHQQQGSHVEDLLFDFINLYSNYFYFLALKLNKDQGVGETQFISRVY